MFPPIIKKFFIGPRSYKLRKTVLSSLRSPEGPGLSQLTSAAKTSALLLRYAFHAGASLFSETETVFLNFQEAQESMPRNRFRQATQAGGPVRQLGSYSVPSPHRLLKNSSTCALSIRMCTHVLENCLKKRVAQKVSRLHGVVRYKVRFSFLPT